MTYPERMTLALARSRLHYDAMSAARAYAVASERLFGEFARHSFLGQEK